MSESIALLQLLSTRGIGPKTISRVLEALSADGARPGDLLDLGIQDLLRLGLELEQAEGFRAGREEALRLEEELGRHDVRILAKGDGAYPSRLAEVLGPSAPPILTASGNLSLLGSPGVAFCGSRNASTAGLELAAAVADGVARAGRTVVSGHATGVDLAAHRAALQAGGATVLVLPEGLGRFRPHRDLAPLLDATNHAVLSEFAPNAAWSVGAAMQRNGTVVALARALVAIEPGTTGGTLDAARRALRLGLPAFVADDATAPRGESGVPALMKSGARLLPRRPDGAPDIAALVDDAAAKVSNAPAPQSAKGQRSLFG